MRESLAAAVYGTPDEVEQQLAALHDRTAADELMISGGAHDLQAQAVSDGLLAALARPRLPTARVLD